MIQQEHHKIVIIGGGPAGLAAAISAAEAGCDDILILERDGEPGGILRQCIHTGFGLHTFGEELSGPEYATRFIRRLPEFPQIQCLCDTTVISVSPERQVTCVNPERGLLVYQADAVILAMGCRERPRGALGIPGCRCAGVFTAGAAQNFLNLKGLMPGREVVILGSGDIGLIMARRVTFAGAKVKAVVELMPYSSGLTRNIVQCLDDFDIPLWFNHTVSKITSNGKRLEKVTVSEVDPETRRPIPGTEKEIACDTLLLSVGLIPENELSLSAGVTLSAITGGAVVNERLQTNVPGIFACGNVLHVHDLVDYVSEEAALAGASAAAHLRGELSKGRAIAVKTDGRVRYTVPQTVTVSDKTGDVTLYFRPSDIYRDVTVTVREEGADGKILAKKRRIKVAPGEMETITVKAGDLAATAVKTLLVSLEENEAKGGNS